MTARIADRIDLDQVEETPWGGRRGARDRPAAHAGGRPVTAILEGAWDLGVLRHCTDTHGVACWGCGRRAHRIGTEPTHWLERLCSAPDCLARKIAEGKP